MTAIHASCDAAAARCRQGGAAAARPKLVLATCILASSLAFVDGSVVNVGLPAIGHGLHAGAGALQWVVNGYLLPLSALLLLGGAAGDRYGRRLLLMLGTFVFGVASLCCAIAPSLGFLLAGRLLQGSASAFLMPSSLALLGATFTGEAKGRAIGLWAASGAVMGAVGPVLGGWLIDLGSWRAIFVLNLPLAAGAIFLAWRFVPRDEVQSDRPLDLAAGILATLALGALTGALTVGAGPAGWTPGAIAAGVAAVVGLAGFVALEKWRGDAAMMPLTLFGSRTFIGLTLLTLLLYGALGALFVLVPYVLIEAAGYSGTEAGAALLPFPLVLAVMSPVMGGLAGRIGSRLPLAIGPLLVAAGFLLGLRIDQHAGYVTEVLPMILAIAFGMSGAVAPLTAAVLGSVDGRHTGSASGLNSAVARTGGLIATALLGAALAAHGGELVLRFHLAVAACAVSCAAASLSAFWLIAPGRG